MKIAVEGCAHGELENIYNTIKEIEEQESIKVDLLICCGDFQSSRNEEDLKCMAVPPKYSSICTFYKYYNGEKKAPVLTIFIGGNHEASNYLQELPYGGWVAPNIYYMGYASVINIGGVRIGGLSGIYKGRDYCKGHFEKAPYDDNTKRSVYHIRTLEVFRLKQLTQTLDIFLSHDWPAGVYNFGNKLQLLKRKPFFKDDIESGQLGSPPCLELLTHLTPKYWFSAHLHCKFAAVVKHDDNKVTKFLALDKCLPKRRFLQVLDIPHSENEKFELKYDLEWLTILYLTNHLLNVKNCQNYMPGPGGNERYNFTPTEEEKSFVLDRFNGSLKVPNNFKHTAIGYDSNSPKSSKKVKQPEAKLNPQTVVFCDTLSVDDPVCLVSEINGINLSIDESLMENTTFISSDNDDSVIETSQDLSLVEKELEKITDSPKRSLILPEPKNTIEEIMDSLEEEIAKVDRENPDLCLKKEANCSPLTLVLPEPTLKIKEMDELKEEQNEDKDIEIKEKEGTGEVIESGTESNKMEAEESTTEENKIEALKKEIEKVPVPLISPKRSIDSVASAESELNIKEENKSTTEESTMEEDSERQVTKSEVENSPQPKKFKRRNANLYEKSS